MVVLRVERAGAEGGLEEVMAEVVKAAAMAATVVEVVETVVATVVAATEGRAARGRVAVGWEVAMVAMGVRVAVKVAAARAVAQGADRVAG